MSNTKLPYPNDRDGGTGRLAAIEKITRKIEHARAVNDAGAVARFAAQLADAKDATKPLPGRTLINQA